MKPYARYIIITAAILALVSVQSARASEISGSISTDGGTATTTDTGDGTTGGNTGGNTGGTGTTTDPGGNVDTGNIGGTVTDGTDATTTPTNTNTNNGSGSGIPIIGWVVTSQTPVINPTNSSNGTTTASTSEGISDEEMARLALANFGPRYGVSSVDFTPGAPDTGGSASSGGGYGMSSLNALNPDLSNIDMSDSASPFAYVPRSGEGPVIPDMSQGAAAAGAIGAAGLTIPQLFLVAIVGLLLLASVGYAISNTNKRTSRAA